MISQLDRWFADNILVYEAALTRYLRRVCRNPADVSDVRQDVYVRVYENAAQRRPTSPKSFLFATARNLMVDRLRRGRIVSIDYTQDIESLNVLADELSPERRLSGQQELLRLSQILDRLSNNCREVIWLRRVEGLSQREAAGRLGMPEGTLESHLSRGIRELARAVFESESPNDAQDDARGAEHEVEHG